MRPLRRMRRHPDASGGRLPAGGDQQRRGHGGLLHVAVVVGSDGGELERGRQSVVVVAAVQQRGGRSRVPHPAAAPARVVRSAAAVDGRRAGAVGRAAPRRARR